MKPTMMDIPSDYPLPNLYYFSSNPLVKIRRQLTKLIMILNQAGFKECHLPFLVPRSILLYYDNLISLKDFIKVYSGKDRRSYVYLRPDSIFSQGITLASKMIKSYRDLPLKLFEVSPGYKKLKYKNKPNIFTSPEQSFSIQCSVFTEKDQGEKYCQLVLSDVFKKFLITYTNINTKSPKTKIVQYFTQFNNNNIEIARLYIFNQEVTRRANIYFFNKAGVSSFPYMYTFSLSQNIFLLKILAKDRK